VAHELLLAGYSVLIVERGPANDDASDKAIGIPGNFLQNLATDANWQYQTTPQPGLNGRVLAGHRGTGLGGSSRLNYMSWVRGPKADFDDWAELVGDDSWMWNNVLPEFKKVGILIVHAKF
jgi:choline dehydrogenase